MTNQPTHILWPNGYTAPGTAEPLSDVTLQRDCARELAAILEERGEKALRLHTRSDIGDWCARDGDPWPCRDRRALTGADEDDAA